MYNKLLQTNFTSFKLSRYLMIQKKKIDNELSIYLELEKKLIDKNAKKDDNGQPIVGEDGIIEFDSEDNKAEYIREIIDLKNTTIDNFEKVTIFEDNFRNANDIPSPNEMLALEEVIDWQ